MDYFFRRSSSSHPIDPLPFIEVLDGFKCTACGKCGQHAHRLECCAVWKIYRRVKKVRIQRIGNGSHKRAVEVHQVDHNQDLDEVAGLHLEEVNIARPPRRESRDNPDFSGRARKPSLSSQIRNLANVLNLCAASLDAGELDEMELFNFKDTVLALLTPDRIASNPPTDTEAKRNRLEPSQANCS